LDSYNDNDDFIDLYRLVQDLEDRLKDRGSVTRFKLWGVPPLRRTQRSVGSLVAPWDTCTELWTHAAALTPQERADIVPKIRGAEQGELPWNFVGRAEEREQISGWLRLKPQRMLVVTGCAGAGKSALLGHLLALANPALRRHLLAGILQTVPTDELPAEHAFDAAIQLTGESAAGLIRRLADAARLGTPPELPNLDDRTEWLSQALSTRGKPFTLVVDALDEAQEPAAIAGVVLRRLAALPLVHLIVGTRASTREGPDLPDTIDEDLLNALGGRNAVDILEVERDRKAIGEYLRLRLHEGLARDLRPEEEGAIADLVRLIHDHDRQFLYARLAVHELLLDPGLLTARRQPELMELLEKDHRGLFAATVARMRKSSAAAEALLEALAFAEGRGLPRADRTWLVAASALADNRAISPEDIDDLLKSAAPYVMLDVEGGQSTYRLAHQTFTTHFAQTADSRVARHRAIACALIDATEADPQSAEPSAYIRHHLAAHVANANAWEILAAHTEILDHLDPETVAAVAWAAFGDGRLPEEIKIVMTGRHELAPTPVADRAGIRALFRAENTGTWTPPPPNTGLPAPTWRPIWSRLNWRPAHGVLDSGNPWIRSVVVLSVPDSDGLLATVGGRDDRVRLWDVATFAQRGQIDFPDPHPMITAEFAVPDPDGRACLALGHEDGTIDLWDPATGNRAGTWPTPNEHGVGQAVVLPQPGGALLATIGVGGSPVQLWRPGLPPAWVGIGPARDITVRAMAAVPQAGGRTFLALCCAESDDIVLWDPVSRTETGRIRNAAPRWWPEITMLPLPTEGSLLAVRGYDESPDDESDLRLWDPGTELAATPLSRVPASAAAIIPRTRGDVLLATNAEDGGLRLWDLGPGEEAGQEVGHIFTGHARKAHSLAPLRLRSGRTLLLSSGEDGSVRIWNLDHAEPHTRRDFRSRDLAVTQKRGEDPVLACVDADGVLTFQNATTGTAISRARPRAPGGATAVAAMQLADGRTRLATAGDQRGLELWEPDGSTGHYHRLRYRVPAARARLVTALTMADGRQYFATVDSDDSARLWDPLRRTCAGKLWVDRARRALVPVSVPLSHRWTLLVICWEGEQEAKTWLTGPTTDAAKGFQRHSTGKLDLDHEGGLGVTAATAVPLPDGRTLLATADYDHSVTLWSFTIDREGRLLTTVPERTLRTKHCGQITVCTAAPAPDGGTLLVTGGFDGLVQLSSPLTGESVTVMRLGSTVTSLAVAGGLLYVGSEQGVTCLEVTALLKSARSQS
jgi:WD40 repeat protein